MANRPQYWHKAVCYEWVRPSCQVPVAHRYDLTVEVMLPTAAVGRLLVLFFKAFFLYVLTKEQPLKYDKVNTFKNISHHLSPQFILMQCVQRWKEGVMSFSPRRSVVGWTARRWMRQDLTLVLKYTQTYCSIFWSVKPWNLRPPVLWHWTSNWTILHATSRLMSSHDTNALPWSHDLKISFYAQGESCMIIVQCRNPTDCRVVARSW